MKAYLIILPALLTALNASSQTMNCVTPPTGLVAWWRAEGNANDRASSNNGVAQGTLSFASGLVGQAFDFSGSLTGVVVAAVTQLNVGLADGFSIETWIKPSTIELERPIVEWNSVTGGNPWPYDVHLWISVPVGYGAGPGCLYANIVDTAGNFHWLTSAGGVISTNNFQHVALTYDKTSGQALLYLDGGVVASKNLGSFTPQTSYNLYLGSRPGGVAAAYSWAGQLDEVSLYSRVLSGAEVQSIHAASNAGKCVAANPPVASFLLNVNFGAHLNPGSLSAIKVGLAATGSTTNDFWNFYSRDGLNANDWLINSALPNLKLADGTTTTAGLVVNNAPGCWSDGSTDAMYNSYIYPFDSGNAIVTFTNLPTGQFDIYVYSPDGNYQLAVAGTDRGTKATQDSPLVNPTVWQEGRQYARFTNINVSAGQAVTVTVRPGIYGYAIISGMQIVQTATNPPPFCVPAPAGLVSWWRAEENANDAADGNNGTIAGTGTVAYGPGVVGQAFVFDGIHRDRVNVGNPTNLRLEDFTLEAWVKRSSPTVTSFDVLGADGSVAGDGACIFGYGRGGYIFALANDGRMILSRTDLDGLLSTPLVTDTNWHHLAVTKAGSSAVFYLDGVPQATPAYVHPDPYTFDDGICACTAAASIGSRGDGRGGTFFGMIDEPAVFNRPLTANEIQTIYAAGSSGKCAPSNLPPVLAPLITSQPTNLTVYVGNNATFRVTATGTAPLAYQWRFNGTNLTGKTVSTLALTAVQFANAGPYSVVVSNVGGSVTSSPALLTVNPLPPCANVFSNLVSWWRAENNSADSWGENNGTSPKGFSVGKVGQAFSFPTISVPDSPSLRFSNAMTIEAWVNPSSIAGTALQTILSKFDYAARVTTSTNSSFYLGLTNGRPIFLVSTNGSPQTNATVIAPQSLPTNQWSHVAAIYNGSTLRLYVNGQFVVERGYVGNIFNGNSSVGLGALPYAGQFVQSFSGLIDEPTIYNRALLPEEIQSIYNADVTGKCLQPPTILVQPQDQAIPLGEDVKFTGTVVGTKPLGYQWFFLQAPIAGATNSSLVLEKLKANQAGSYQVRVTNSVGLAWSIGPRLTLLPPPSCTTTPPGLISWWPGDGNPGDAMGTNNITSFSPTLYVTGKVDRAFSFNGNGSRILVNNSTSLNFGSNADFSIEMWIKTGARLDVFPNIPLFEKRDDSTSWIGYSLSLNQGRLAFAMGSSPLSATNVSTFISPGPDLRDAMFHHVAMAVNRTNSTGGNLYVDGQLVLTFDPTQRKGSLITQNSLYLGAPTLTTSNSSYAGLIDEAAIYSRALTAAEILAIRNAGAAGKCKVKPSILVQPISQRVTVGSNVTFSVTATGSPKLRYQWLRNGGTIPLATNATYSFTVLGSSGATYSVRATNLFGSVLSSNAVLTVNNVPTAFYGGVTLNEDTSTPITLIGTDPDNDPLTYVIVTPPEHGSLSVSGSNCVYTPSPNYNGPDSFTFKVNDGLVDSLFATVSINVVPVNDPPIAQPQSVALDEDMTAAITLGASDVENDPLTFTVGTPTHGTFTGTAPNLVYHPLTNYFGPDSFTFSVSDGQTNSALATVSLTVRPVNDPPVAEIVLAPLNHLPGVTNLFVIAPVGTNATVILDGSRSTDVENDPLQYFWSEGTNTFATDVLATNQFAPGLHTITLIVSDGQATGTNSVVLEVLSPAQAVATLTTLVESSNLDGKNANPLLATLRAAAASFDRGNSVAGINQLQAFQNKVLAQIAPLDPSPAAIFIQSAQEIIDVLSPPTTPGLAGARTEKLMQMTDGKFQLRFRSSHTRAYFIEASTNLTTWQIIGVARDLGQDGFDFEDVHSAQFQGRFYRVVEP